MEDQVLLDLQLLFESSEPEQQPKNGHDDENEATQTGSGGRVSENDEATAVAMNDLALRTRPPKNNRAFRKAQIDGLSDQSDAQHESSIEAPTTRLRKRKSPEIPDTDTSPKKKAPTKPKITEEPDNVEPKPVSGQLSRPANPLNPRKVQDRKRTAKNKDKFDFMEDSTPQVPAKKANQANGKLPKARGRSRKDVAKTISGESLPNEESAPVAALRTTKSPSIQDLAPAESGSSIAAMVIENSQVYSREQSESPGAHQFSPRRHRPNAEPSPPVHQQSPLSSRSPKKASRMIRSTVAAVEDDTDPKPTRPERDEKLVGEQECIEPDADIDIYSVPDSVRGSTREQDDRSDHDLRRDESSDDGSSYRNSQPAVSKRRDGRKTSSQPDAKGSEASETEVESSKGEDEIDGESNEQEDYYDDDEPSFELFGGIMYWRQVMDGVKKVGTSNIRDEKISKKPRIMTTKVQGLLVMVEHIKSLYEDSSNSPRPNESPPDDGENMWALLDELGAVLDSLKEVKVPENDRSQSFLIQDIYAHAIPNMVVMLKVALRSQSNVYSQPDDTESLEEILCIQDQIIKLCERARRWKADTLTTRPIKGAVAKKILPYMRSLRKRCFEQEFDTRMNVREHSLFVDHWEEVHRNFLQKQQKQKEENRRKIIENLKSFNRPFPGRPKLSDRSSQQHIQHTELPQSHQRSQSATQIQWTREQNEDLVHELLSEKTRYLPAPERYLSILNIPSLQNMLPEHIRERSLYYKDLMIQEFGSQDYLESIE